jgi:hypothetical protein
VNPNVLLDPNLGMAEYSALLIQFQVLAGVMQDRTSRAGRSIQVLADALARSDATARQERLEAHLGIPLTPEAVADLRSRQYGIEELLTS